VRARTARFAVGVAVFVRPLLSSALTRDSARQLLRAATGVAANYRATGRSRSRAEFAARIGIVVEEADECVYWLEFLEAAELVRGRDLPSLLAEARELTAMFTAAFRTARAPKESGNVESGNVESGES
jgi:four helix bundle protein